MSEIIIKKENDYLLKGIRKNVITKKGYIIPSELSKSTTIPTMTLDKINREKYPTIKNDVNNLLSHINSSKNGANIIANIYKNLKFASTKDEVHTIIKDTIKVTKMVSSTNNENKADNRLLFVFKSNADLFTSIFVKRLLALYFSNLISNKDISIVNRLHDLKIENANVDDIFASVGETFEDKTDANNCVVRSYNMDIKELSTRILYDVIDTVYDDFNPHLCWESCKYARADKCEKIKDVEKKKINDYDFITSGYQLCDSKSNVKKFVVTGCKNYKKEEVDKEAMSKLREKLNYLCDLKELCEYEAQLQKKYRYSHCTRTHNFNYQ